MPSVLNLPIPFQVIAVGAALAVAAGFSGVALSELVLMAVRQ